MRLSCPTCQTRYTQPVLVCMRCGTHLVNFEQQGNHYLLRVADQELMLHEVEGNELRPLRVPDAGADGLWARPFVLGRVLEALRAERIVQLDKSNRQALVFVSP